MECLLCRLKDYRRIATHYNQLAVNFLATIHIAVDIAYWLWVRSLKRVASCVTQLNRLVNVLLLCAD